MANIIYPQFDLYHYTSLNTLLAILENKTIRLTDYRFLNDTQELTFAINELRTVLNEYKANDYCNAISQVIDDIETGQITLFSHSGTINGQAILAPTRVFAKYYVLSLSCASDSLPMWKMYAKHGCCLKFNSQKLLEFFHNFRDLHFEQGLMNISNGPVIYGSQSLEDRAFINNEITNQNRLMLVDSLLNWCLKRKSPAFSYETEFRIAFHFEECMMDQGTKKVFSVVDNAIKPQLELQNFPISEILEEVIISPYITSELTQLGIQELLAFHKLDPNIVHFSDIAIR